MLDDDSKEPMTTKGLRIPSLPLPLGPTLMATNESAIFQKETLKRVQGRRSHMEYWQRITQ
jgi:hypothetical protein